MNNGNCNNMRGKKKNQDAEEGPELDLGEVVGKRGNKRGSASRGVEEGEGCKKKPFSLIALSSSASALKEEVLAELDRSKGSGISGVTGLRTSAGKSRILGDKISCLFLGEKVELFFGEKIGNKGFMLRFL